jgi:hypothetical protein
MQPEIQHDRDMYEATGRTIVTESVAADRQTIEMVETGEESWIQEVDTVLLTDVTLEDTAISGTIVDIDDEAQRIWNILVRTFGNDCCNIMHKQGTYVVSDVVRTTEHELDSGEQITDVLYAYVTPDGMGALCDSNQTLTEAGPTITEPDCEPLRLE